MFIYASYDAIDYEIVMLKFETKELALKKIKKDLKKNWVPWMEEVYNNEIIEDDMIISIIDTIKKKGKYVGSYNDEDIFSISLKEFN